MARKGKKYERETARKLGKRLPKRYHGPDALNGKLEAKDWKKPMSKYDVKNEIKKGRTIIVSSKGFTDGAIDYVKRYHHRVKLYKGKKRIIRVK
jgi:hypothetical protein